MSKLPISLDLGLGAKAEIRAEIKTEIPSESSGKFLETITDIFRPFSERRGLRADQIRLQREDVLIEIARKAQERLAIEGKLPNPIPNRVLIPFIEKASLSESGDEVLTSSWSNILAVASNGVKANHSVFVDILGKLDSAHLHFLSFIAQPEKLDSAEDGFFDLVDNQVRATIDSLIEIHLENETQQSFDERIEQFSDGIASSLRRRGSCLIAGGLEFIKNGNDSDYYELLGERDFKEFPENISGALEGLNLIKRVELHNFQKGKFVLWVDFHVMTMFGYEFFYACHDGRDVFEI